MALFYLKNKPRSQFLVVKLPHILIFTAYSIPDVVLCPQAENYVLQFFQRIKLLLPPIKVCSGEVDTSIYQEGTVPELRSLRFSGGPTWSSHSLLPPPVPGAPKHLQKHLRTFSNCSVHICHFSTLKIYAFLLH